MTSEALPKLPEDVTREQLLRAHIWGFATPNPQVDGGYDTAKNFDGDDVLGYNVWVLHVTTNTQKSLPELDRDFFVRDYPSRKSALAAAREYAWQIAAKYNLEIEEY